MEATAEEKEVPAEVLRAVFAHGAAALGGGGAASAACVSRAWRAAAGPHGVVRAALGSEDADERVRGCKAVDGALDGEALFTLEPWSGGHPSPPIPACNPRRTLGEALQRLRLLPPSDTKPRKTTKT